jgi:hypothetical protein
MIVTIAIPTGASNHHHKNISPSALYLAAATRANTRRATSYSSLETATTFPEIIKDASSLATASDHFVTALTRIHWKGKSAKAAHSLEKYMRSYSQFLRTAKYQSHSTLTSWSAQLTALGNAGTPYVNALRHDLGLSPANRTTSTSSSTTTTTTTSTSTPAAPTIPTLISPPEPTYTIPTTPPTPPVTAWSEKYTGNEETLNSDVENIDTADQELLQSIGGSSPLNYEPILSASQQLASDVVTAQHLPAIPDTTAESYWSTDLSDLAVAAADYLNGFTDNQNGDTTDGPPLIQQGSTEIQQATIQDTDLVSRLTVDEDQSQ